MQAQRTPMDIWHDDEGVWRQVDGQLYGPFETEDQAERVARCWCCDEFKPGLPGAGGSDHIYDDCGGA